MGTNGAEGEWLSAIAAVILKLLSSIYPIISSYVFYGDAVFGGKLLELTLGPN